MRYLYPSNSAVSMTTISVTAIFEALGTTFFKICIVFKKYEETGLETFVLFALSRGY